MNMEIFSDFFINHFSASNLDILIKLFISLFLGLIIGLEREITNKTAGLRTHILVCLGSTVFTILSVKGVTFITPEDGVRLVNDPTRIAAQILTGIGFIGGGAVLHYGVNVFGITTAATLWIAASIGMSIGFGSYFTGVLATFLTFIVLVGIRKIENLLIPGGTCRGGRIKIAFSCFPEHQEEVHNWIYKEFKNIQKESINTPLDENEKVKLAYIVEIYKNDPVNFIYKKFSGRKNIETLAITKVLV